MWPWGHVRRFETRSTMKASGTSTRTTASGPVPATASRSSRALCLGGRAGKAVEQEPLGEVVDGVHEHGDDELVGDQATRVHVFGGLAAEGRAGRSVGAQNVAGTDVGDWELRQQAGGLRSLTGAGRA